jgi:hypothetical protein
MDFKLANSIIIENFGIWYSPVQLCKFIEDYKGDDKDIIQALKIMYNHIACII